MVALPALGPTDPCFIVTPWLVSVSPDTLLAGTPTAPLTRCETTRKSPLIIQLSLQRLGDGYRSAQAGGRGDCGQRLHGRGPRGWETLLPQCHEAPCELLVASARWSPTGVTTGVQPSARQPGKRPVYLSLPNDFARPVSSVDARERALSHPASWSCKRRRTAQSRRTSNTTPPARSTTETIVISAPTPRVDSPLSVAVWAPTTSTVAVCPLTASR